MRNIAAVLLAFVAALASAQSTTPPSQVTLGLNEYETMRDRMERPSATVVDTIRLGGTFRGKDLTIGFSGRSIGNRPQVIVVDNMNDVTISGCNGAAIVTRSSKGSFALIPVADSFDVKCDLRLSGSDRLSMHVLSVVLDVQSSVADGELIAGDEDDGGARNYSLVRQVATTSERLAATATGRYRITLLPDASRFHYSIDVRNPNRTTSTLSLSLLSNEHLQQIDSAAPYEVEGNRYTFTIPPGDSSIQMSGELRGSSFRAPVDASLQYLVIESHPLIRPSIQSQAKRVSIAETGISPQYRGALAFEAGKQQINWTTTRLEALRAISYAAKNATHRVFVPLDGPVLGESTFHIRNEGAAEIILPREPEPTYVSLQDEPVFMTKDKQGRLTVPLSTGEQSVFVQHRQRFSRTLGVGAGSILLPQLEVATSHTHVTMTYPGEWIPLYEKFGTRSVLWTPDFAMVVLFLAMAVWIERLLAWLGVPLTRRLVFAAIGGLAATIIFSFLVVAVLACTALTVAWLSTLSIRMRIVAAVAIMGVGLFVLVVLSVSQVSMRKYEAAGEYDSVARGAMETAATGTVPPSAPPPPGSRDAQVQQQQQSPAYQGLPAKFDLPSGSRHTRFEQELLPTGRRHSVFIFAISMALVKWVGLLVAIVTIGLLVREWRALADALKAKLNVTPPAPAQA